MKPISDIRLYRSMVENRDGNPLPSDFGGKRLHIIIHRIVMKLREQGFSVGEFDHLYINFTTCLQPGEMGPAKRSVDPYHKWYRYYDVGVDDATYHQLDADSAIDYIVDQLLQVLITFFADKNNCSVRDCVTEAVAQGESMQTLYKTKQTAKLKASIYLQLLDSGKYVPHLFVWDSSGEEVLHKKLNETADLQSLGEIQLSSKRVTVKPRKNAFSQDLVPVIFDL